MFFERCMVRITHTYAYIHHYNQEVEESTSEIIQNNVFSRELLSAKIHVKVSCKTGISSQPKTFRDNALFRKLVFDGPQGRAFPFWNPASEHQVKKLSIRDKRSRKCYLVDLKNHLDFKGLLPPSLFLFPFIFLSVTV